MFHRLCVTGWCSQGWSVTKIESLSGHRPYTFTTALTTVAKVFDEVFNLLPIEMGNVVNF